jgi:cellulose synthase operon protein C
MIRKLLLGMASVALFSACGAQSTDELFADAKAAMANGDVATAKIHLRNLLQQQADHVAAREMLAETALASGDIMLAEQSALRAIEQGSASASAHLVVLQAFESQAKYEDIVRHFESMPALEGDADNAQALSILGSARHSLGDLTEAEQVLRRALSRQPDSPNVATRLASLLLDTGQGDEARRLLTDALERDSQYSPALILRASIELAANQVAAAEATLKQVLENEQGGPTNVRYFTAAARLVEIQLSQKRMEEASAGAEALLRAAPSNPFARFAKAAIEFASGDLEAAETRLQALTADAPQFWPAYRILGQIDARQGQLGQAEQALRTAVTNDPRDGVARLHLAEVYVRQGDIAKARQVFAGTEAAQLSDELFLAIVGGASLRAGQSDLAASYFDSSALFSTADVSELRTVVGVLLASGQDERALSAIEDAKLESAEDRLAADYLTASVHVAAGNLDAAAELADRLAGEHPELGWTHSLRGSVEIARENPSAAKPYFLEAVRIEPGNVPTLLVLANLEAGAGDLEAAGRYLQRIVETTPGEPNAVYGLTRIALTRGDTAAAKSWIRQVPDSAQRTLVLGQIDAVEGNFGTAADKFASVYDVQPSFDAARLYYMAAGNARRSNPEQKLLSWVQANPLDAQGNAMLGSIALGSNDFDNAIERFEVVRSVEPNNAAALNNLAWLYDQRGDDRALAYAERAYANAPDAPSVADTLGWMLFERGETARALDLLEAAAIGDPKTPEIQYHLAAALIRSGKTDRGADMLRSVLASAGAFGERAEAEELLRSVRSGN